MSIPHSPRASSTSTSSTSASKHTNPDDVQLLLVRDDGPQVTLMANAGGSSDLDPLAESTVRFDDEASQTLPDEAALDRCPHYRPAAYWQRQPAARPPPR